MCRYNRQGWVMGPKMSTPLPSHPISIPSNDGIPSHNNTTSHPGKCNRQGGCFSKVKKRGHDEWLRGRGCTGGGEGARADVFCGFFYGVVRLFVPLLFNFFRLGRRGCCNLHSSDIHTWQCCCRCLLLVTLPTTKLERKVSVQESKYPATRSLLLVCR